MTPTENPYNLQPVNSANIHMAGYNEDTHTMYLMFKERTVYAYTDVPLFLYQCLMSSESPGKWFAENIRKQYTGVKV